MNSVNSIVLLGHLTRNPELRYTSEGRPVCNAGLALNRRWVDLNGDKQQETTFVEVTIWGHQGEVVAAYRQKGQAIAVEGRLEEERWKTATDEKRSRIKVVAERVTFIGPDGGAAPEAESLPEWVKEEV